MNELTAYLNGEWIPNNEVKIHATDRGFLVGDTVFDVARTFNGKSFRMKEHVARLYRSLQYARIDPSIDKDQMLTISEDAIKRNEPLRQEYGDFTRRMSDWWCHLRKHLGTNATNYFMY